jgi:hypothetical protein
VTTLSSPAVDTAGTATVVAVVLAGCCLLIVAVVLGKIHEHTKKKNKLRKVKVQFPEIQFAKEKL